MDVLVPFRAGVLKFTTELDYTDRVIFGFSSPFVRGYLSFLFMKKIIKIEDVVLVPFRAGLLKFIFANSTSKGFKNSFSSPFVRGYLSLENMKY